MGDKFDLLTIWYLGSDVPRDRWVGGIYTVAWLGGS